VSNERKQKKVLVAVTGATGMLYVPEFLNLAARAGVEVEGIISASGRQVLRLELEIGPDELPGVRRWFPLDDFTAPPSSGSSRYHAMVILPCTMGTLGAIASGSCVNLIHRAADVFLKERRPLVLAVRETPLNRTHLSNMLAAQEAGAIICPAMPSFYMRPRSLAEMARGFAARICDQISIAHDVAGWASDRSRE
jgi:4-hydroxy-3-polyprenylbenzoate decarboxylase